RSLRGAERVFERGWQRGEAVGLSDRFQPARRRAGGRHDLVAGRHLPWRVHQPPHRHGQRAHHRAAVPRGAGHLDGNVIVRGAYPGYWGFDVTSSVSAPKNFLAAVAGGPGTRLSTRVVKVAGVTALAYGSRLPTPNCTARSSITTAASG